MLRRNKPFYYRWCHQALVNTHHNTMKSPFELRTELLAQAQKHLTEQYEANLEFATDIMYKLYQDGTATARELAASTPKFPTTEDILAKAKEFYSFVNTGK